MKVEKSSMIMKQMWKVWRITVIRKEIREAELNGEGEDERMSSTLSEKTMYYAATPGQWQCAACFQHPGFCYGCLLLAAATAAFVAVSVSDACSCLRVFASRLSGRVVEPLNGLDLEHPDEN